MFRGAAHADDVTPEEEPVEPRPVVEDYQTRTLDLLQVSTHLHLNSIQKLCRVSECVCVQLFTIRAVSV